MTDIRLADISEFQPVFDADAYLAAGHAAIIARSHNGYRPDHMFPTRRDALRVKPFDAVGYYQYLAADRDPVQQAYDFIAGLGELWPNEFPILDLEEGSGDQTGRARAWFQVIDPWCGFRATLYSGLSFLRGHLGGPAAWPMRPLWVAAYGQAEPAEPHMLWQFTDAARFAGLPDPVDGNLYHGTAPELLGDARQSPILSVEEHMAITAALSNTGALHVFVEAADGSVWYTWQKAGETKWAGGQAGKQIAGLAPFAPKPGKK